MENKFGLNEPPPSYYEATGQTNVSHTHRCSTIPYSIRTGPNQPSNNLSSTSGDSWTVLVNHDLTTASVNAIPPHQQQFSKGRVRKVSCKVLLVTIICVIFVTVVVVLFTKSVIEFAEVKKKNQEFINRYFGT
ncbi:uncharacterized protein LOC116174747 [Photinus pyralis]|uniref:uncharacterized protein LOC116174747 n=1 Tax=Photinus pyralis TaxID=7054 RepID=UPI0012676368|nr:uncharacterized protein LOC116174747 [Photinus pyralis]